VLNFGNYYDSPDIQDGGDGSNSCSDELDYNAFYNWGS
jgi:hypothetical protein